MELGLEGKRALITGASRGIGHAIATALAAEGCSLAICARDAAGLEEAAARLRRAGASVHGEQVDVADAPALERFVGSAAEALGGLDLLVANAGGSQGGERIEETTAADWRASFDLNVVHAATAVRAAVPHLRAADGASVLIIASISGSRPQPRSQYAAAKAAEIQLAASLARELGPDGIRVNSLSPGSIMFPGGGWEARRRRDPGDFARWVGAEFPLGRLGSAEEVANVAAFLLSPRASWVSGADIAVDGAQNQPNISGW